MKKEVYSAKTFVEADNKSWMVELDRANNLVTVYQGTFKANDSFPYTEIATFPLPDSVIDNMEQELDNGETPDGWEDGNGDVISIDEPEDKEDESDFPYQYVILRWNGKDYEKEDYAKDPDDLVYLMNEYRRLGEKLTYKKIGE